MSSDERNRRSMQEGVETLDQISKNPSTPKTVKKSLTDLLPDLNSAEYSMSVRAANAISALTDITEDPNVPSYVRTQLWQAVSKLEAIRE